MKTKERVKQNGEVMTPPWLVQDMLDKLPEDSWEENKTFLDNSCGTGNFLAGALVNKLANGHNPLSALKTIYGVDIMQDNIKECRHKLLELIEEQGIRVTEEHCRIVLTNICWLNSKKYPKGSLDYDFSFRRRPGKTHIRRLLRDYRKSREVSRCLTFMRPLKRLSRQRTVRPSCFIRARKLLRKAV